MEERKGKKKEMKGGKREKKEGRRKPKIPTRDEILHIIWKQISLIKDPN